MRIMRWSTAGVIASLVLLFPNAAIASAQPTPRARNTTDVSTVKPLSASGCTGNTVCIFVVGTGLHVDSIAGGVAPPGGVVSNVTWCGYIGVTVYKSGTYYTADESPYGCANSLTPYDWTDYVNKSYPSGSKACLWAYTVSTSPSSYDPGGPPCENIG